jgi:TonB family protein
MPRLILSRGWVRVGLLAVGIILEAATPASADDSACTELSYAKLRPPKYPSSAAQRHAEGNAIVVAKVGVDGVPAELRIDTSSGDEELDGAALASVAEWRFNPRRCNGKPTVSMAKVPVTFSLTDGLIEPPREFQVIADDEGMEFPTVARELDFLRSASGVNEHRTPTGSLFVRENSTRFWILVEEGLQFGSEGVGSAGRAIIRTRLRQRGNVVEDLYTFVCGGHEVWCGAILQTQIAYLRDHPPPPPPPGIAD